MKAKNLVDVVICNDVAHLYFRNGSNTFVVSIPVKEAYKLNKHLQELL